MPQPASSASSEMSDEAARRVGGGRVGRAEQRDEHAVGEDRAGRRQVAVHADVARDRAHVRAGADEVDTKRQLGGGEPVGDARAHRHEAVAEPRHDLREAERAEVAADLIDARVDRGGGCADRERAQPRAPALEPLGDSRARIGAEVGDVERESLDRHQPDRKIREHEPADAGVSVERERQPPRSGGHLVEHGSTLSLILGAEDRNKEQGTRNKERGTRSLGFPRFR